MKRAIIYSDKNHFFFQKNIIYTGAALFDYRSKGMYNYETF